MCLYKKCVTSIEGQGVDGNLDGDYSVANWMHFHITRYGTYFRDYIIIVCGQRHIEDSIFQYEMVQFQGILYNMHITRVIWRIWHINCICYGC